MYSREEVKAITDKVINMAKADAVEVEFTGGERSATRFANSNITANMVQYDRNLSVTVLRRHAARRRPRRATSTMRRSRRRSRTRRSERGEARENPEALPLIEGPQDYIPVDAALPSGVNFGPAERAQMVKQSLDICQKKGVIGSGYIPKTHQTTCTANSKGLFAYYQYAEASFILTCRTQDGGGSGWAGITGIKDVSLIDAARADRGRRPTRRSRARSRARSSPAATRRSSSRAPTRASCR